jgi:predicted metalloprotease with PDZ domain
MRCFSLSLATLVLAAVASAELSYVIEPEPAAGMLRVALKLTSAEPQVKFRIPAWCPGFYSIKNYQNKISDVKVTDAKGNSLPITHTDPRQWVVDNPKTAVTLSYRVKGDDGGLGFFGVTIKPNNGFINGPAAFMYPEGRLNEKIELRMQLPQGWSSATAMNLTPQGYFSAENYDEFIDHPIELGKFQRRTFRVEGYDFEAVYSSPNGKYPNLDESAKELADLSAPAIKMFGGAPFKRYVYIIHLANGDFNGGLEHRASTLIQVPAFGDKFYLGSLASHEFFHTWNVKNIRPKVLGPFDYTTQVRTGNLWFAEGVTDYYAQLHTHLAGRMTEQELLHTLGDQIDSLQNSRTRLKMSLEDACRKTWDNNGFGFDDLSYYNKGLVVGLVLDAAIRDATNGQKSLDDVMRLLMQRHALPKPGYEEDALRTTINEVAMADLTAIYNQCVRSTQELPYSQLQAIGLEAVPTGEALLESGIDLRDGTVTYVSQEAAGSGLQEGDRILDLNLSHGNCLHARYERNGAVNAATWPMREGRTVAWSLRKVQTPTDRQMRLYQGWLKRNP